MMPYPLAAEVDQLRALLAAKAIHLPELAPRIKNLRRNYQALIDPSPAENSAASFDFYSDLDGLISPYYDEHVARHRSVFLNRFDVFGFSLNKDEYKLANERSIIKGYCAHYKKLKEEAWNLSAGQTRVAYHVKKNGLTAILSAFFFGKADDFGNYQAIIMLGKEVRGMGIVRAKKKIKFLAARLMGKKLFTEDLVTGIHPLIVSYKVKRDLERFKAAYFKQLSFPFQEQLEASLRTLEESFQLNRLLGFNRYIADLNGQAWVLDFLKAGSRQADLVYLLKKALLDLKPGKKFVLQAGYFTRTSGHAVVLEFYRQPAHFKMTCIDTGGTFALAFEPNLVEAAACQTAVSVSSVTLSRPENLPVYTVNDLSIEELNSTDLLRELIQAYHQVSDTHEQGAEILLKPFRRFHSQGRLLKEVATIPCQTNKTCGYDSLLAWLSLQTDSTLFLQFQRFIVNRSLTKVDKLREKAKRKLPTFDTDRILTNLKEAGCKQLAELEGKLEQASFEGRIAIDMQNSTLPYPLTEDALALAWPEDEQEEPGVLVIASTPNP